MSSDGNKSLIAIIDLGLGNLFSVKNACDQVGLNGMLTSSPEDIQNADALILPGVGAYGDAMHAMNSLLLISELKKFANSGKPFMGVCLGMQLLMNYGTEFGNFVGLGLIEGSAERFQNPKTAKGFLKVPEICWNQLSKMPRQSQDTWMETPLEGLPNGVYMYFNHSYYVKPSDPKEVIATTIYGDIEFCSAIKKGNIFGIQCHPERSGKAGLVVYRNFAQMIE